MNRREWARPKLLVLARQQTEETALVARKHPAAGSDANAQVGGCGGRLAGCASCDSFSMS
jgi:hypothetical protein